MKTKNAKKSVDVKELSISMELVNFRDIKETELNAQEMNDTDFKRLVENLKRDKVLTSAPLIMREEGKNKYKCISGHHRIKAGIKAGIENAHCLIVDEVDESTRIRLQIAHNDIHGTPNEEILSILQDKLNEIDVGLVNLVNSDLEPVGFEIETSIPIFSYINICLLEKSRESLVELIESLGDKNNENYLVEEKQYEEIKDLLTYAFSKGFKTPGQAFGKFIEIIQENKKLIER